MPGTRSSGRSKSQVSADERTAVLNAAHAALRRAYAPYSRFRVGAALLTETGSLYAGCNVENASYGLTNCAERTAIYSAVAAEGPAMRIRVIAVWSNPERPCAPCGSCRQVIFEFGPQALVMFQGPQGVQEALGSELLPAGFVLESTQRDS